MNPVKPCHLATVVPGDKILSLKPECLFKHAAALPSCSH